MQIGAPQVLKVIALGLGIAAGLAALLELSRHAGRDRLTPAVAEDPLGATLHRCRNLTSADDASAADCRAAWEESRRHFLGLPPVADAAPVPAPDARPGADPAGTE